MSFSVDLTRVQEMKFIVLEEGKSQKIPKGWEIFNRMTHVKDDGSAVIFLVKVSKEEDA